MGEILRDNYLDEENFVPPEPGLIPVWMVFEGERPVRQFSKFKDMYPWYLSYKKNCLDVNVKTKVQWKLYWRFKEQ